MFRQLQDSFGKVEGIKGVVPISKGGTGATTAAQAVTNLGGINRSLIGQPNGVASADSDGLLDKKYFEDHGLKSGLSLEGPATVARNATVEYHITNYNVLQGLNVTVTGEGVTNYTLVDGVISFKPTVNGTVVIDINGKKHNVNVVSNSVFAPKIVVPNKNFKLFKRQNFTCTRLSSRTHARTPWTKVYPGASIFNFPSNAVGVEFRGRAGKLSNLDGYASICVEGKQYFAGESDTLQYIERTHGAYLETFLTAGAEASIRFISSTTVYTGVEWQIASDSAFTNIVRTATVNGSYNYSNTTDLAAGTYYVRCRYVYGTGPSYSSWSSTLTFETSSEYGSLTEKAMVTDTGLTTASIFGQSVAHCFAKKEIAIGDPGSDAAGTNSGSVVIYSSDFGTTKYLTRLHCPGPNQAGSEFGCAVAYSPDGEFLYVGARLHNESAVGVQKTGYVYVYKREGINWRLFQKLSAFGNSWRFGVAIATSQDSVYIGDDGYTTSITNAGIIHRYKMTDNGLIYVESITAPAPYTNEQLGFAISVNPTNTHLFATSGAWGRSGNKILIFKRSADGSSFEYWTSFTKIPAEATNYHGVSLAADIPGRLVVGDIANSVAGTGVGAVYIYDINATTGAAVLSSTYYPANPDANMEFGRAVAVREDGTMLWVGAQRDIISSQTRGSVYIFY